MDSLDQARERIDEIDRKMAVLFEERMRQAARIAVYKKDHGLPVYVPEREKAVIETRRSFLRDKELAPYYTEFLQHLMDLSKQYQERTIEEQERNRL